MKNSEYYYVVADYYATGEGTTKLMLVTRAYPQKGDYEDDSDWRNLKTKNTGEFRAMREFIDRLGEYAYFARGAEILKRDEFLEKYGQYVAPVVIKLTDPEYKGGPANFNWLQTLHMNFS